MLHTFTVISLAASAVASTDGTDGTLRPWKAAGPGDSRGPCPMLNTLANHGYLPHNGRNLSVKHFGDAVVQALNTAPAYGTRPASVFVKGWGKDSFDLENLNTPGILQHISSLSRKDITPTEKNIAVHPPRVAALLDDSLTDYVDVVSIAKSRLRVEALSEPKRLSTREELLAYIEASLLLMIMKEGEVPSVFSFPAAESWKAPKERVRVWLTEERLPEELGWKRSERTLGVLDLVPIMKPIFDEKRAQSGKRPLWKAFLSKFWGSRDEL
ncbi:Chloroperoxidase [Metarhizium album ARSEF 1941]|uniref:Chloroperoxidase n=1 Tax=Metarhizium album (strain ARSEF 1941) TaxID=1081103 RepID=A0A0B2WQ47_METAS|nr:Chloroperoxidase [Metarhizium album ARSEF 1941]KHN96148.1 Chloroperoxidase [Metarhizium album ARSEF 1941]